MKRIEKMLPEAIKAVSECKIASENQVDSAYSGYISSLGASIISAGLLPTLIFFSDKGGSQANRPAVVKAIEQILVKHDYIEGSLLDQVKDLVKGEKNAELSRIAALIADAAVALKLAIRTFPEHKN